MESSKMVTVLVPNEEGKLVQVLKKLHLVKAGANAEWGGFNNNLFSLSMKAANLMEYQLAVQQSTFKLQEGEKEFFLLETMRGHKDKGCFFIHFNEASCELTPYVDKIGGLLFLAIEL